MPAKGKNQNKQPKKDKKRKNISPLSDSLSTDSTRCHVDSGHSQYSDNVQSSNQSKRVKNQAEQQTKANIFAFDTPSICHMASMNMASMNPINYSPYPTQFLQSPPGQFLTTASTVPPPWASTIMEDIKSIKSDVARIENIEKLVNSMNLKLKDLETKITDV